MTDDQRLIDALRSMQPDIQPTEQALGEVRDRSHRRRRHQRFVRGALGAAAAVLLIGGAVAVANLGRDDDQAVVVDQPDVSAPTATTVEVTTTTVPERLTAGELDQVVGIELRTWWFGDDPDFWDGFWEADPNLVDAVVAALLEPGPAAPEPDQTDEATIRFERSDGTFLFRRVDVESGWVEPDQQLPEDIIRQLRTGLNDAVASPWEEVDLTDPNSYLTMVLSASNFPAGDVHVVTAVLLESLESNRQADYERWFIDVVERGDSTIVEIRHRGMGDDSSRGADYVFSLLETYDGVTISWAMSRHLCLRSEARLMGPDNDLWGCL